MLKIKLLRFTIRKKRGTQIKYKWGGVIFAVVFNFHVVCMIRSGVRGGGSVRRRNTLHVVGGREFILTSAVYGERDFIL